MSLKRGAVSQRFGSADPDAQQNVTNPQHFLEVLMFSEGFSCSLGVLEA
jgi:hypothetical protein